ncbi:MAG: DEAD/DEAH box helicase [Bacteroidia bacterium]|nr:DEAD/DEAH box helicase [Bacteroidia bacterium]
MKVLIENSTIILNETEELKKYQISQLEYYGFHKNNNALQKQSASLESDILQVIGYFREEELLVEFTPVVEKIIVESEQRKSELNLLFKVAKEIKDGAIASPRFTEFKNFIESLPRKLKPHQIKAAYHLYSLKNGANFSVPGSGKTSVVLSVYEKLKSEEKCNILFVIGPPSCFQPWKHEFLETLGRKVNSIILSGGSKIDRKSEYYKSKEDSFELYLCTFHTALNDYQEIIKFLSQPGINAFVIVDEAHYMKQIGGSWATSLLNIGKYANAKCILTGTPIPKSYRDVFNLFDFLWEEDSPLENTDKIQIELLEKKKKNEDVKSILESKIGPLFYRVRKKDLGLIPPVIHPPIVVKMNSNEESIYKYVNAKILDLAQEDYFKNEVVLNKLWKGRIMRLRQAVSYPKLLLTSIDDYSEKFIDDSDLKTKIQQYDQLEIPGKLKVLTGIVLKLREENKKVLIWSNFIGTLELIKSHFTLLGEGCELIYGKTPIRKEDSIEISEEKTREDIRDEFLDTSSGLNILIANPAACAESISLHKTCFHAIYYDLSYNCAQYIQSLDRIHRVGGSEINEANYYFLQYENSLDQDIKNNLELKAQKMYDVIEQDYTIYDLDLSDDSSDDDIAAYKRLFKTK